MLEFIDDPEEDQECKCPKCLGEGYSWQTPDDDPDNGDYEKCDLCRGTGTFCEEDGYDIEVILQSNYIK